MIVPTRHPLPDLTPARLARAIVWPFVIVVGGATAMLALAAASVGLNPIAFAGDFLAAAAVDITPLAMRLLAIWAIYTTLYLMLAWDVRFYAPRSNAAVHPALRAFVGILLRWRANLAAVVRGQQFRQVKYSLDRATPSCTWSPGTHPQIE